MAAFPDETGHRHAWLERRQHSLGSMGASFQPSRLALAKRRTRLRQQAILQSKLGRASQRRHKPMQGEAAQGRTTQGRARQVIAGQGIA